MDATLTDTPRWLLRRRWSMATGGDVRWARVLEVGGDRWIVALAGSVLQAADATGRTRWSLARRMVSRVIAAGDLTGDGDATILARGTQRELMLLDARTGTSRWTWTSPEGTFVQDAGAVLLLPLEVGHRLIVAPIYGTTIEAFDLVGDRPGRHAWTLAGTWDAGFGPSMVAADMDGDGSLQVVLSSRRGDVDRSRAGRHTSAETVLGKRRGQLYQAIMDAHHGTIRREVAWTPNPRGHRCARPYGLLTTTPTEPGGRPSIVLGCCQVEEYLAVTHQRSDGTLGRGWSRFVEKDWPHDRQELRVHPDSVQDLRGDGRPELVSSLWDGVRWRTSVQAVATGRDRAGERLADRVLWACLRRADGGIALVVGEARQRSVAGPTTLELVDGASLEVIDRRRGSVLVGGGPLASHVAFMAERRDAARLSIGASEAVVVRDGRGALHGWWADGPSDGLVARVGGPRDVAVLGGPGGSLVADRDGRIRRLGPPWGPVDGPAGSRTRGRVAAVDATRDPTGVVLGVGMTGDRTWLGRPEAPPGTARARRSTGGQLALHVDDHGRVLRRASVHEAGGRNLLRILEREDGDEIAAVTLDAPLDRPVQWMTDGGALLTLRTGTHTLATEVREADGRLRWRLKAGAYLHAPACATIDETPLVVLDDHGVLHLVDGGPVDGGPSATTPDVRWRRDWTAAYGQPIVGPFLAGGRMAILRANGIHGMELLDLAGRRRWRLEAPLWRYATGDAVIARSHGRWMLVAGRRDGRLDGIDARDGRVLWSRSLADGFDALALASADLHGSGEQVVLVGLPDGRLLMVEDPGGTSRTRALARLRAGIARIVPLPEPGGPRVTSLVIVTVDGRVQLFDVERRVVRGRARRRDR
ncbi:MAG: PQQ-binding-like beta-propeller repeat protein [Chloroflexi bacterium]|nr:PQQ-binding-like beta-propeller repeat protein [Chloroflexota bacterium]